MCTTIGVINTIPDTINYPNALQEYGGHTRPAAPLLTPVILLCIKTWTNMIKRGDPFLRVADGGLAALVPDCAAKYRGCARV
jgi:hypothetical protein